MTMHTQKNSTSGEATYSFYGDNDTGVDSSAANQVEIIAGGTTALTSTSSGNTLAGATALTSATISSTLAVTGATTLTGALTAGDILATSAKTDFRQRQRVRVMEDFFPAAGATLPAPWGTQDTSSAGSPTLAYVNDAANGAFTLTHDAQSEAQNLTLYFADQLVIPATAKPVFECRMKVNFAGAAFSADQRIVIGLAAARNATLDNNAKHAWFRIEGASLNIYKETDDGTTDSDDKDTGIDIVDDTYTTFRIDMSNTSNIGFYVDNVAATGFTMAAAALASTDLLQPYIEIQRDAGTEAEAVTIDYIMVEWDR